MSEIGSVVVSATLWCVLTFVSVICRPDIRTRNIALVLDFGTILPAYILASTHGHWAALALLSTRAAVEWGLDDRRYS